MGKRLVAYFSATGVTKKLAKKIVQVTGADEFEIVPKQPYTKADINWKNPVSRCNKEKIVKKDVPVAGVINNIEEYDTIYLGFPIWYWGAPNVINTFVKHYDMAGKKIFIFATSDSSNIGKTAEKLRPFLSEGAEIVDARVMNNNPGVEELRNWARY